MTEDFEKILLGGFIRHPEIIDGMVESDFNSLKHRAVFKSIVSLIEKKSPIDPLLLSGEAKNQGLEIPVADILELRDFYCGEDIEHYKGLVKDQSRRRNLQSFLSQSLADIQSPCLDYPEFEGRIFQSMMGLINGGNRRCRTSQDIIKGVIQTYYDRKAERENGVKFFGIPTGFKSIDDTLAGFQPGAYGIVAGRQHHGKSTVAMDFFLNAIQAMIPSLYVSLEQPSSEVLLHLLQKETALDPLRIKTGDLCERDERILTGEVYKRFREYPLHFEDRVRIFNDLSMGIRRMVFSHEVRFVVVDYLQLVENRIKGEPRHIEVAGISRGLKRLAMDLNISILTLSQLNKSPEERESKRISLADMRESEAISQDADFVIFIHRPRLMGKDDRDHLELAKNRHGKTVQRINVEYDGARNTYREKVEP